MSHDPLSFYCNQDERLAYELKDFLKMTSAKHDRLTNIKTVVHCVNHGLIPYRIYSDIDELSIYGVFYQPVNSAALAYVDLLREGRPRFQSTLDPNRGVSATFFRSDQSSRDRLLRNVPDNLIVRH